ncbi:NAD-dependent histone deacetylase sirtuin-1 [Scaptodrosophila lebanonensis]|uniref:protein acetyllysine N-acetyltransferase n=1 Tax=Drosophila lebanonensis TaxID=7225 RepID=A0A6J2TZE1_DROLE|nr:NAD-dependent histone deacetylase sirtuin-1 [Scaptodrosophila lebanonensis]
MMENYEDIRLAHINSKEIVDMREVKIQSSNEYLNFDRTQANFGFGAEMLSINTAPTSTTASAATSEHQGKANCEIKTKTLLPTEEQEIGGNADTSSGQIESDLEQFEDKKSLEKSNGSDPDDDDDEDDDEEDCEDDDDDDDDSSSECSSLGPDWKMRWLQREFYTGRVPRQIIASIMPHFATGLAADAEDSVLWDYLAHLLNEPKRRTKLTNVNTFDDVIELVQKSENIIVLTGAGVSVSCGIPDFRSTNGIYARLAHDFPDLPDPQAMFDINYFKRDPRPFYKFAREIYPGEFKPSPCHRFIKMLETKGKLLRNYTQNIDTLEQVAGIQRVIECHGSFSTASCTKCKYKCNADALRADIFAQRIPVCPQCQPNVEQSVDASVAVTEEDLKQIVENGIMKPDIVFFGEGLPDEYHTVMATDKDKCDLLIVIGSSLKVRPVAHIPSSIPGSVPQILINREQLHHLKFDVELLGDSDVIINQICHRLAKEPGTGSNDWLQLCCDDAVLNESKDLLPIEHLHHHRHSTSESEQQSQLDTDTQSLKSNGSADYLLGSAGTCSDSGFESSTFTSVHSKRVQSNAADRAAIERIKSDILVELNETAVLSCDRLAAPTVVNRHLSIDSSKDSGIEQCEFSNPAQPEPCSSSSCNNEATQHNIYVSNAGTSGDGGGHCDNVVQETKTAAPSLTPTPPQRKRQSAAERLFPGTFYCHTNNCSYVFPGAQVFWDNDYSDLDDDDDEDDESIAGGEDDDACDLNAVPLSPLLPPSVEAHIVTEIANSALDVTEECSPTKKRRSETAETALDSSISESQMPALICSPPPIKKRRSSAENLPDQTQGTESSKEKSTALAIV